MSRILSATGLAAAAPAAQGQSSTAGDKFDYLPKYARAQHFQSLKHSSADPTGGNKDYWNIPAGQTLEVFNEAGPGVITHIWFTIASNAVHHLKEIVLRGYWDNNSKPSIETPIGDFFGLNLGQYAIYESAYLACSPGKSLNCYFAMPYRSKARLTVTNEGATDVRAFYSNIDYQVVPELPADALYFHVQYRQSAPCTPVTGDESKFNRSGDKNYIYAETSGRGHLMGVTLGILQNADGWWGEGDEMIFVDGKLLINGTGSEDYFLGSWDFGGRDGAMPFSHRMYGAPLIAAAERTGGRYCCYRWHGDNPVTFTRSLKHTMEHGHGNDRHDNFYSVCYWYQTQPFTDFPALPPAPDRVPKVRT